MINDIIMSSSLYDEDASMATESVFPIGYVDFFVFSTFLGLLLYWFFVKRKKPTEPIAGAVPAPITNG